ncbi:hypothetical protein JCM15519_10090 [Fundidesulfovibrio butyratiphilus]
MEKNNWLAPVRRLFPKLESDAIKQGSPNILILKGAFEAWQCLSWVTDQCHSQGKTARCINLFDEGDRQWQIDLKDFTNDLSYTAIAREIQKESHIDVLAVPLSDILQRCASPLSPAHFLRLLKSVKPIGLILVHIDPDRHSEHDIGAVCSLADHVSELRLAKEEWAGEREAFLKVVKGGAASQFRSWEEMLLLEEGEPLSIRDLEGYFMEIGKDHVEESAPLLDHICGRCKALPIEERLSLKLAPEIDEETENIDCRSITNFRFGFAGLDGPLTRPEGEDKKVVSGFYQAYAIGIECEAQTLSIYPWLLQVILRGLADGRQFVVISLDDTYDSFEAAIENINEDAPDLIRRSMKEGKFYYIYGKTSQVATEALRRNAAQQDDGLEGGVHQESPKNPTLFAGKIRQVIACARNRYKAPIPPEERDPDESAPEHVGPVIIINSYSTLSSILGEAVAFDLLQDLLRRELWELKDEGTEGKSSKGITAMLALFQKNVLEPRYENRLRQTMDGIVKLAEHDVFGVRRLYHRIERIPNMPKSGAWYSIHTVPHLGSISLLPEAVREVLDGKILSPGER